MTSRCSEAQARVDVLTALSGMASALDGAADWNVETCDCRAPTPRGSFTVAPRAHFFSRQRVRAVRRALVADRLAHALAISSRVRHPLSLAFKPKVPCRRLASHVDALMAAAKSGRARERDTATFSPPHAVPELDRFDAVVLDPPRPCAAAQASAGPSRGQVSVRVLQALSRAGSRLSSMAAIVLSASPIDAFWSPHVELFAQFAR